MISVSPHRLDKAPRLQASSSPVAPSAGVTGDQYTPGSGKKIWLVHGSHTGGHKSAAQALETALEKYPTVDAEVINLAETSSASTPMSTAAETALKAGAWVNSIRRWVFDQQFEGNGLVKWASDKFMALEGRSQDAFLQRVKAEKPDAIVSTMSATNSLLSHWKETGKIETPVHSVVTDFASHQMWSQDSIAFYYVASPQVKADLERFGTDSEKVEVTGIPIRSDFSSEAQSSSEARRELGLDPDKPLVLMLGGSLGYGQFQDSIAAIDQHPGNFQLAAITGRNQELQKELSSVETEHSLEVQGFVRNMPTWIEAADLVITKPGGLTCSEILAKGKPMLLQRADSGLEKRMVDRLEESGAAVVVDGAQEMGKRVAQFLLNPEQLDPYAERAGELGRAGSSAYVAGRIIDSLGPVGSSQQSSTTRLR